MKLRLLGSFFIFSILVYGEISYQDVSKEHWAYKAINNLVENQIIDEKEVNFNGNASLTRYQFAYELSKLFNKLDMEKIDKKEIEILRGIVTNFSAELNKIGFDYKEFEEKLSQTSEDIDTLKKMVEVNNIKIKNLEDRLKILEKEK